MVRKRDFNSDEVIEKSMKLFWEKGFHGTSLSELTKVTGLHKGSLYSAFKSKENLFELSLHRYAGLMRSLFYKDDSPLDYLKTFFQQLVEDGVSGNAESGCLVMNSSQEFGQEQSHKADLARALFQEIHQNFENVMDAIKDQGELKNLEKDQVVDRLVGATFSIRELSKFHKERELFVNIANGVLKNMNITVR